MKLEALRRIAEPNDSKIVLFVLDGVGGTGTDTQLKTELEVASTPNLDDLASQSICGLHVPVGPGITPGSGPGHLSLFGYDPLEYQVGRGVLSALGIDFDLQPGDVAARGNFCSVDEDGYITDRRAGRISTELNEQLVEKLQRVDIPGVDVLIETVKGHRFLLVLRGEDLGGNVEDTDPQDVGERPIDPRARDTDSEGTCNAVRQFVSQAREILADEDPANMVILRGFAQKPDWPTLPDTYGIDACVVAQYPMYRGVARLAGMEVLDVSGGLDDQFAVVRDNWDDYDFFFIHEKRTDKTGEDGDFDGKVDVLEEVDRKLPQLLDLDPDVVIITGDHSTPSALKAHSWHPVPVMIYGKHCRPDGVEHYNESACLRGGLGARLPGKQLMPIAMANAGRLEKFGA